MPQLRLDPLGPRPVTQKGEVVRRFRRTESIRSSSAVPAAVCSSPQELFKSGANEAEGQVLSVARDPGPRRRRRPRHGRWLSPQRPQVENGTGEGPGSAGDTEAGAGRSQAQPPKTGGGAGD